MNRQSERQMDRQTGKHKDWKTGGQTDRWADKEMK